MIEQHVTSLEISKRLKELGVGIKHENNQESIFYWHEDGNDEWELITKAQLDVGQEQWCYSAFLASELGELLPKDIYIPYKGNSGKRRKYPQHLHCFFGNVDGRSCIVNYTGGNSQEHLTQAGNSEANARGKMLIYLLEQGIIRV